MRWSPGMGLPGQGPPDGNAQGGPAPATTAEGAEGAERDDDRDEDGEIDLSEALGTSLISLPAPVYNLYTKVGCFFPYFYFLLLIVLTTSAGQRHRREVVQI